MQGEPDLIELKNNTFLWDFDGSLRSPVEFKMDVDWWHATESFSAALKNQSNRSMLSFFMGCKKVELQNELSLLRQWIENNSDEEDEMELVAPLYNCIYCVLRFWGTGCYDLDFIDTTMQQSNIVCGGDVLPVRIPQQYQRAPSPLPMYHDYYR
jgi:hypothetical protein